MRDVDLATTDDVRTERSGAATQGVELPRTDRNKDEKSPLENPTCYPCSVRQRTEDGTDIYIILIYSSMLNVAIRLHSVIQYCTVLY